MNSVISVENLSKRYVIGHQKQYQDNSLRDLVTGSAKRLTRRFFNAFSSASNDSQSEDFWALRDVSFQIHQSDRIGIIGRNGAGKSTLLKILSRITEPTFGRVSINGRVASLLEVGTGFHPELSGRENIFLNGAILGMSKAEIKRNFDAIVSFSEVETFLDTPVKRYSSGMYVRLAFAVAAHLEPEILIVDEVLAVGDAQFQKKCLGKMEEFGKDGRTVIFVSHNVGAIRSLCNQALLLDHGSVVAQGETSTVIEHYLNSIEQTVTRKMVEALDGAGLLRNDSAVVTKFEVCADSRMTDFQIDTDTSFQLEVSYTVLKDGAAVGLNLLVYDGENRCVLGSINNHEPNWYGKPMPRGNYKSICSLPKHFFNNGFYSFGLVLFARGFTDQVSRKELLVVQVEDGKEVRGDYFGVYASSTRPFFKWNTVESC